MRILSSFVTALVVAATGCSASRSGSVAAQLEPRTTPAPSAAEHVTIFGKPVPMPAGCWRRGSARDCVDCPGGTALCWKEFPASEGEGLISAQQDVIEETWREAGMEVHRDRIPCVFAGTRTTCRRTRATDGTGSAIALLAAVTRGEGALTAHCVAPDPTVVPCSILFEPR